ncbi:hypothetical protein H0W91_00855 [Patescibacteria group bacterium]|nr:hypothetical protein [Patescibacteria group bacterium]
MKRTLKFEVTAKLSELRQTLVIAGEASEFSYPESALLLKSEAEELERRGRRVEAIRRSRSALKIFWTAYTNHLSGNKQAISSIRI